MRPLLIRLHGISIYLLIYLRIQSPHPHVQQHKYSVQCVVCNAKHSRTQGHSHNIGLFLHNYTRHQVRREETAGGGNIICR